MHSIVTEKVPNGKLVRIKVDYDTIINSIQITGDFFLHPEDTIELLEKSVTGASATSDVAFFKNNFETVIKKSNATLIGVTTDDLARLTKQALEVKQ